MLKRSESVMSSGLSWSALWDSIGQLIVKSLLSVAPHLAATYRATVVDGSSAGSTAGSNASAGTGSSTGSRVTSAALAAGSCRCFEVLGYDVSGPVHSSIPDTGLRPMHTAGTLEFHSHGWHVGQLCMALADNINTPVYIVFLLSGAAGC